FPNWRKSDRNSSPIDAAGSSQRNLPNENNGGIVPEPGTNHVSGRWAPTIPFGGIMNDIRPGREIEALEKTFGAGKLLDSLPIGVCCCGCDGRIRQINRRARELWGRSPETDERFDGAYRLFLPDGTPVAREEAPMAQVLRTARPVRNRPFNIERPDG